MEVDEFIFPLPIEEKNEYSLDEPMFSMDILGGGRVTHWMKLPEAPKEEPVVIKTDGGVMRDYSHLKGLLEATKPLIEGEEPTSKKLPEPKDINLSNEEYKKFKELVKDPFNSMMRGDEEVSNNLR